MITIGEFSNICKVSTKTLRYYDEIGLLKPSVIDPDNGYRYYSIDQLEKMLFINRMKSYSFSLDEIKRFLQDDKIHDDSLYEAFNSKKTELEKQVREYNLILSQMESDMSAIKQGKSVMSYMDDIDVQLVDVPLMNILFVRKNVMSDEFPSEYANCYGKIFKRIAMERLTITGAPMVLFHSPEYTPSGLDTEFAVPVKEVVTGTRDFIPGLCLKTVVRGEYSELSSVYAKQIKWADKEGYKCTNALFEVYVTDPSRIEEPKDNITEVYYPVKKIKG